MIIKLGIIHLSKATPHLAYVATTYDHFLCYVRVLKMDVSRVSRS